MTLHAISVVLPYRTEGGTNPPLYNIQVEAVSSTAKRAIATAQSLSYVVGQLHHGGIPRQVFKERAMVDPPRNVIAGPYAYLITKGDRVPHLAFPPRMEEQASQDLSESLGNLDEELIDGILFDLAPMASITSTGLAGLVEHCKRLNIHFFRPGNNVRKVLDITGLINHLDVHEDIRGAMDGLLQRHRRRHKARA